MRYNSISPLQCNCQSYTCMCASAPLLC